MAFCFLLHKARTLKFEGNDNEEKSYFSFF